MNSDTVFFPQTEVQFDDLVRKVVKKYKLPDKEHAAVVIANRIMHLPPDQASCTMDYLGHCVMKNIAYQVAQSKASRIAHHIQVDQLASCLKSNLNDAQSRDALQKAAAEGSDYAQSKLDELFPTSPTDAEILHFPNG